MTEEQQDAHLSDEQRNVCRHKGTEAPFSGKYYQHWEAGHYHCACCQQPLFASEDKYDSGSGWPSYTRPIDDHALLEIEDDSHGMQRTEVVCARCRAHLGHVFEDGPQDKTGLRYCINSLALNFDPK